MTQPTPLEERLTTLVAHYHDLKRAKHELASCVEEQVGTIRELEKQNAVLRAQIDELGKQRFTVKQLRDERKLIKRKLTSAMTRLNSLEEQA